MTCENTVRLWVANTDNTKPNEWRAAIKKPQDLEAAGNTRSEALFGLAQALAAWEADESAHRHLHNNPAAMAALMRTGDSQAAIMRAAMSAAIGKRKGRSK